MSAGVDLPIVVYGASGHGKVVADAVRRGGGVVLGFLDDDERKHGTTCLSLPVVGGAYWLETHAREVRVALGIGDNGIRARIAERARSLGAELATVVHPSASVAESARVGAGTVVFAGAIVNADASIEGGVIVNTGAIVEHDCRIGAFAHVSPRSVMGGAAAIGARSQLGIGATILPLVEVGADTIVGGGAVVVRAIGDGVVAVGVPARVRRAR